MENYVRFKGELVQPIALDWTPAEFFGFYVAAAFFAYFIVRIIKGEKHANRLGLTAFFAPIGATLCSIVWAIPTELFSEFVYPLAESTLQRGMYIAALVGAGWYAHIAWTTVGSPE